MLNLGRELISVRHRADLYAVLVLLILRHQFFQLGFHPLPLFALQSLDDSIKRNRFRRDVNDALDKGL